MLLAAANKDIYNNAMCHKERSVKLRSSWYRGLEPMVIKIFVVQGHLPMLRQKLFFEATEFIDFIPEISTKRTHYNDLVGWTPKYNTVDFF